MCLYDKDVLPNTGYTVIGHERDAKSDPGQIDQKVIAGELDFRHEIELVLLEDLVQEFIGRTVFVQHKDRILKKL